MHTRVHSRLDLPIRPLVDSFLTSTREEDPRLFKMLSTLDDEGKRNLAGVLGRFDREEVRALDPERRLWARRVLLRLRRPTTATLALLNRILDYVDVNSNTLLEPSEVRFFLEVSRAFEEVESPNETLSPRELGMLHAFLRAADRDHDGRLSPEERRHLRERLRHGHLAPAAVPAGHHG